LPWAKKTAKASPKDEFAQQMLAAAKAGELRGELRTLERAKAKLGVVTCPEYFGGP